MLKSGKDRNARRSESKSRLFSERLKVKSNYHIPCVINSAVQHRQCHCCHENRAQLKQRARVARHDLSKFVDNSLQRLHRQGWRQAIHRDAGCTGVPPSQRRTHGVAVPDRSRAGLQWIAWPRQLLQRHVRQWGHSRSIHPKKIKISTRPSRNLIKLGKNDANDGNSLNPKFCQNWVRGY